jgi:hypothetical protein
VENLELIHASRPNSSDGSYLLDTEPIPSGFWMIHNKRTERVGLCRRRIIRGSDLSAFDGRVLAYRGIDG